MSLPLPRYPFVTPGKGRDFLKALFILLLAGCFLLIVWPSRAAHIIGASALTNRVIVLRFVDGTITYHKLGQHRTDDRVKSLTGGRLSSNQSAASYHISSPDDSNFTGGRSPVRVGVNVRVEQTWAEDAYSAGAPTDVRTTTVYLFLPAALQRGKTYVITTDGQAANVSSVALTYDEGTTRSDAVHVNNLGYVPAAAKKYGYIYAWLGDQGSLSLTNAAHLDPAAGTGFRLLRTADHSVAFSGQYAFRKARTQAEFGQTGTANNNFLGADVYECDFSAFTTPGDYVLAVDGVGCSYPFQIGADIYREPFYWVMKALFENRSGIELNTPYAQYHRPAPHRPGVTPGFHLYYAGVRHYDLQGLDADAADRPAIDQTIKGELTDTWGWYQDAGDWDSYAIHARVPAYLLALYEANPAKFNQLRLDIPESAGEPAGTALPDLLDEARWLPRFYKRLKDELVAKGWGSGGVGGGRVFGDLYESTDPGAEDGRGSWQDQRKWVCLGEDPWMTYKYAALAAQLASILSINNLTDPENIDWRAEATRAWTWAQQHTRSTDDVPKWDYNLVQARMTAAAALYRLTGDQIRYEAPFIDDLNHHLLTDGHLGLAASYVSAGNDDNLLLLLLAYQRAAQAQPKADAATKALVNAVLQASAAEQLGNQSLPISQRAARWGGDWYRYMGFGQSTTPRIQAGVFGQLALAGTGSPLAAEWLANTYTTADYFLGNNPLNMTMISGVGDNYPAQVFHMDSWYAMNSSAVKKGIIPYGSLRSCEDDNGGCNGYAAPYQYYYGLRKAYPAPTDASGNQLRPGHERYMPSRTAPIVNEFTIYETLVVGALTYGFLYAQAPVVPTAATFSSATATPTAVADGSLLAYPNPSTGQPTLSFSARVAQQVAVYVYDQQGSLLSQHSVFAAAGRTNFSLPTSLPRGIYYLRAAVDGQPQRFTLQVE